MSGVIRILIADDHPIVREGLSGMLRSQADFQVVGEATTGREAVDLGVTLTPDVILMDLRMPELDGASATALLRQEAPNVRVLVLTTYDTDGDILRAIEAGAVGYLLKDVPHEELFLAIRATARGERRLASVVAEKLMQRMLGPAPETLTPREQEVLECVARGASNKKIAPTLGISEPTVKAHLVRIFEKLSVEGRTAAVMTAIERGLIRRP